MPLEPNSRRAYFGRLFPPTPSIVAPAALEVLAASTESRRTPIRLTSGDAAPAGYTYFGQFIDHDLTHDRTPLDRAADTPPEKIRNFAGGRLDLHHLYGDGPDSARHRHLYESDGASFRLGPNRSPTSVRFDFPLDAEGFPATADHRNLENLILRQLCVVFLRLHNLAVREIPESLGAAERFRRARDRTVFQYQWLVLHDYLPHIIAPDVYTALVRRSEYLIDWQTRGFAIPVEFSQAAFRFGHSMVRETYDLNHDQFEIPLTALMANPDQLGSLPTEQAIEWRSFFSTLGTPAMLIDTAIVPSLFRLPDLRLHRHRGETTSPSPMQLPLRTLQRGALTRLASGQQVARALDLRVLTEPDIRKQNAAAWELLCALGLQNDTPLWYYTLLEAEAQQNGRRLGAIGSRLVAETIAGCLTTDADSFLNRCGRAWTPPPWRMRRDQSVAITQVGHVPAAVGLVRPS